MSRPDSTANNAVSAVCVLALLSLYGVALLMGKLLFAVGVSFGGLALCRLIVWLFTRRDEAQRREMKRLYGERI